MQEPGMRSKSKYKIEFAVSFLTSVSDIFSRGSSTSESRMPLVKDLLEGRRLHDGLINAGWRADAADVAAEHWQGQNKCCVQEAH